MNEIEEYTVEAEGLRVEAEGFEARALQHEIDHLDGMLYIDRMPSLDDLQRSEPVRKREADARRQEEEAQPVE